MRTPAVAVALLALLAAPATAQVAPGLQPLAAPDWGAYEPREELAVAGDLEGARRVLRFVQVSDAHILDDDAPFPLRVENLDPAGPPVDAAQRPQDEFTDEVLDSIVRAINAQHAADPLQFVLNTGDNIDNDLENELLRFLDLYDGTVTTAGPLSGTACRPDGQSASTTDGEHDVRDTCTSLPEALAAMPGRGLAAGLPWFSAFGNHDALIQGNVNVEPGFQDVADQFGRRFLQQDEYVALHFAGRSACPGAPAGSAEDDHGHGYGLAGERLCDGDPDNDGYYALDAGPVRFLVLDTVNDDFVTGNAHLQGAFNPQQVAGADVIGGYAEGAVDPAQAAWLMDEVERAGAEGRLVAVASHHTVNSMFTNLGDGQCAPGIGCLGDLVRAAGYQTGEQLALDLAQHPHVVAWFGGHTHRHRVEPKGLPGDCPQPLPAQGCPLESGFWNVESSSLIDWPQEARAVELWVAAGGAKAFWRLTSFGHAFEPSRDLMMTDPHRVPEAMGTPGDRDVLLWFDVPPGVRLDPLPEPERRFLLRVESLRETAPGRHEAVIAASDVLHPGAALPLGLSATWSVTHADVAPDGAVATVVDAPPGTPLEVASVDNGTRLRLRGEFTSPAQGSHYAQVRLATADGREVAAQLLSLDVPAGPRPRDDPEAPALPALLAGLAVVMLAALRRRSA